MSARGKQSGKLRVMFASAGATGCKIMRGATGEEECADEREEGGTLGESWPWWCTTRVGDL
jgi:hypothetical protein